MTNSQAPQPEDGGPAFPVVEQQDKFANVVAYHSPGMSLRDYFAATAMTGMFAAFKHWPRDGEVEHVADLAYEAADALLKARTA